MPKIINWKPFDHDFEESTESLSFEQYDQIPFDDYDSFESYDTYEYEKNYYYDEHLTVQDCLVDSIIMDLDNEIEKYLQKKVAEKNLVVDNYANINLKETSEIPVILPVKKIIPYKAPKPISFDDVIIEMKNRKPRMDFLYQIIWLDQINKEIRGFKKDKLKIVPSPLKDKEYSYSWYESIVSYFWV